MLLHYNVAESTIEARIVSLQDMKKLIAYEVVKDEGSTATSSTSLGGQLWTSMLSATSAHERKIDHSDDDKVRLFSPIMHHVS